MSESLGGWEMLWEHECFYNSIEIGWTCFHLENTAMHKRKSIVIVLCFSWVIETQSAHIFALGYFLNLDVK